MSIQTEIVRYIGDVQNATADEIKRECAIDRVETAKQYLQELEADGIIERVTSDSTRYRLTGDAV